MPLISSQCHCQLHVLVSSFFLCWDIANITKANQNIYPAEDFGVQPSDVTSK